MNKKLSLILSLLLISISSFQAQIAMGNWRTHFAYNNINQLTQSSNKVFVVSDGSLFSIDKRDGNMEFYSKLSGLNATNISNIEFDKVTQSLLIIYLNGNIDFMSEGGVSNLPDYYNKQMTVDKGVNHILFHNNKAYLSCNFGIVSLNMTKREIQDTYIIGSNATEIKILNTAIQNDKIYAVTSTDIYEASLTNPFLASYEYWSKLASLPGSGNIQYLTLFENYLIMMRNGKLYKRGTDNVWADLDVSNTTYTKIKVAEDYLLAFTVANINTFDKQFVKKQLTGLNVAYDGVYDVSKNLMWFAAGTNGVVEYNNATQTASLPVKPNGPEVNVPYKMCFSGEKLFVVQGGRWASQYDRPGMVMIFENDTWKNISNSSIKSVTQNKALDFMDIAVDPSDNKHFLVSAYGNGVFEFENDAFSKWYNSDNSALQTIFPGKDNALDYIRMDGGTMDQNGYVWFSNAMVSNQIKVKHINKDSTRWISLYYPMLEGKNTLGRVLISNQNPNQKWIFSTRYGVGLGIIDDNGTIDNTSDDKSVLYTSFKDTDKEGTFIIPEFYFSMAQDHNGVIWVGTFQGPLLFTNPNNAFNSDFTCTRVKIPRNDGTNLADYLLEKERINAIAIDGANRKWIGTESSGVYLLSENGQKIIRHFTSENSPLLSNNILSIAINPVTGEVFFGTTDGLVSYQSDAAESSGVFENVHAYPNPVRENFTGIITITGLIDKTNIKITDLAGNLVCQTVSNGSIATWDGKNGFGRKVSTGVYLAICISPDGEHNVTTKILVIN